LAGEFLREARHFIEDGMHPRVIIQGFREASTKAVQKIKEIDVGLTKASPEEFEVSLVRCAETVLNSKLIAAWKGMFGRMVVDAVLSLDEDLDKSMIGIKHVTGGSVGASFLVKGVAFKKTFSYAGFEQ
jgi:T-complex protein 1 subunit eta